MVPDLVPEIVPARVGTEILTVNIIARRIGFALFIVLLLVIQTSGVLVGSRSCLLAMLWADP